MGHETCRQFVAALDRALLVHLLQVTMLAHQLHAPLEEDWRVARSGSQHILHLNLLGRFLVRYFDFRASVNPLRITVLPHRTEIIVHNFSEVQLASSHEQVRVEANVVHGESLRDRRPQHAEHLEVGLLRGLRATKQVLRRVRVDLAIEHHRLEGTIVCRPQSIYISDLTATRLTSVFSEVQLVDNLLNVVR